ncbi:DJ-1/PfpI family protein [uncultured Brachyspira sp.]|uniref:DJ-1/PfpI family protein n=1 Tax=uncultured Brachyspira sp. TaxID=221953 RepID=UPI002627C53F|nr:DJ-1/PfpI family protein [uncultured Brachyspira sp.]
MGNTNKILFVLSGQNFQDEEYFESKKIFENAGYKTEVSSTFIGTAQGKLGGMTNIDLLFSEVDAMEFDAVVFIGGIGCITLWDDWRTQGLAKLFLDNQKVVAGIGSGVVIMANAKILDGVNVTCLSADESHVRHGNANIMSDKVVVSGSIITANGPDSSKEFANTIVNILNNVSK